MSHSVSKKNTFISVELSSTFGPQTWYCFELFYHDVVLCIKSLIYGWQEEKKICGMITWRQSLSKQDKMFGSHTGQNDPNLNWKKCFGVFCRYLKMEARWEGDWGWDQKIQDSNSGHPKRNRASCPQGYQLWHLQFRFHAFKLLFFSVYLCHISKHTLGNHFKIAVKLRWTKEHKPCTFLTPH